jgi:ATP-dependent DNA helicase MPH1
MSSDGYFDDDPIDSAILEQLDAIEAAYYKEAPKRPPLKRASSSDYGVSFNFDESELARLDEIIGDGRQGKVEPVAGPSEHRNKSSSRPVQTTLFGDVLSNPSSKNKSTSKSTAQVSKSTPRNPFGQQAKQTKKWDHTAFAKTGLKQGKSKAKDKWRGSFEDEEEEDVEQVEFEQFPAPFVSGAPPLSQSSPSPESFLCSWVSLKFVPSCNHLFTSVLFVLITVP